jgi:hypothetical protein
MVRCRRLLSPHALAALGGHVKNSPTSRLLTWRHFSTPTPTHRESTGKASPTSMTCGFTCQFDNNMASAHVCIRSLRCVTIWFQNKRQIERRTTTHSSQLLLATPPGATTIYSKSLGSARQLSPLHSPVSSSSTLVSHPRSSPLRSPIPRTASLPQHSFLDAVVLTPRTPTKTRPTLGRAHTLPEGLWERMPGSPTKPMRSPEKTRSFVERTRGVRKHRTLEWACAAARLPSLDGDGDTDVDDVDDLPDRGSLAHVSSASISGSSFSSTNNDSDAVTLPSSSPIVGSTPGGMPSRANHDEETLIAARVLCGLGQR